MQNASYFTYRARTPMVMVRPIKRLPQEKGKKMATFLFDLGGRRKEIRLPLSLIEIWRYIEGNRAVLEVEVPRWLAERIGLVK